MSSSKRVDAVREAEEIVAAAALDEPVGTGFRAWTTMPIERHGGAAVFFAPLVSPSGDDIADAVRVGVRPLLEAMARQIAVLQRKLDDTLDELGEIKEAIQQRGSSPSHDLMRTAGWLWGAEQSHEPSEIIRAFLQAGGITTRVGHTRRVTQAKRPSGNTGYNEGREFFDRNKAELLGSYEGKYVAVGDKGVYDYDADYSRLAERVFKKNGARSILIRKVERRDRVVEFRRPFRVKHA